MRYALYTIQKKEYTMLKNYLKIAFRNLSKHKGSSFIIIFGLAVGIACFMLIFLYVSFETSFDTYHEDSNRIYRIVYEGSQYSPNGKEVVIKWKSAFQPAPLEPDLKKNLTQIESSTQIHRKHHCVVRCGQDTYYEEGLIYANPGFLSVFSTPLIQGNETTALSDPYSILITRKMAVKYFGTMHGLGQTIIIDDNPYKVTGIVENVPQNTSLPYQFIASFKTLEIQTPDIKTSWSMHGFYVYVKLRESIQTPELEKMLTDLYGERSPNPAIRMRYVLQSLKDVHLNSEYQGGVDSKYLYIFSIVGVLILIIACINSVNLITARASVRTREIGMRKVVGANRYQLIRQFLWESFMTAVLSLIGAMLLISLSLPFFNHIAGTDFTFIKFTSMTMLCLAVCLVVMVGLIAGGYPALYLSAFSPSSILKGKQRSGVRSGLFRKIMVIGQFAVSVILIVSTLFVNEQLTFMKKQPLGFKRQQKLILPIGNGKIAETFRNELIRHPGVSSVAFSNSVLGRNPYHGRVIVPDALQNSEKILNHLIVDSKFIPQYGIKMAAGRKFDSNRRTDDRGIIINESAVRFFGWSSAASAIGSRFCTRYLSNSDNEFDKVIGVVKDFHYMGLQNAVEPLVIIQKPDYFRFATLTINKTDLQKILAFVKVTWKKFFPQDAYRYFFLDEDYDLQYRSETHLLRIMSVFTILAILISCLGLFALSSFITMQRTKEIGVRKVLGSSITQITILLSREFLKWIIIANLIAWPVAYFVMHHWLENFAYKTQLGLDTFILSSASALLIAAITVSITTIHSARKNPVESLRYE